MFQSGKEGTRRGRYTTNLAITIERARNLKHNAENETKKDMLKDKMKISLIQYFDPAKLGS